MLRVPPVGALVEPRTQGASRKAYCRKYKSRRSKASVRPLVDSIFWPGAILERLTELVVPVEHLMDLRCHPSAHAGRVRDIQVLVRRSPSDELHVTYCLNGDIPEIRIPSARAPRIGRQLWHHTCFEAFIAVEGQSGYHEFNFAPSGEWAVYAFLGYRNRGPHLSEIIPPRIAVRSSQSRLELETFVRLDGLSAIHRRAPLRLGLSAVIEADDGLSYWALSHPTDKPDFHNADVFALALEPPDTERGLDPS
jgi:hypothetical protein